MGTCEVQWGRRVGREEGLQVLPLRRWLQPWAAAKAAATGGQRRARLTLRSSSAGRVAGSVTLRASSRLENASLVGARTVPVSSALTSSTRSASCGQEGRGDSEG